MELLSKLPALTVLAWLAGCTSSGKPLDVLANTNSVPQRPPVQSSSETDFTGNQPGINPDGRDAAFASPTSAFLAPSRQRVKKTYLINGLASNIGNIGYGFTNLSNKIPGSILYNYASFVESSTVIRSKVTRELKAAYRANPNLEINLIGISFGANIVTIIAQELDRKNIPVNYLATLDGPAMIPIRDNVRVTDNFTCTNLDCFKTNSRLAWGNKTTRKEAFRIRSSHIPLANHSTVHNRILQQINAVPTVNYTTQ